MIYNDTHVITDEQARAYALKLLGLWGYVCEVCGKKKASKYEAARRCQHCLKKLYPELYS